MIDMYRGECLPVTPCCAQCDRRGYVQVRTLAGVEWRCDWHVTQSYPLRVKRRLQHRVAWYALLTGMVQR